MFITTLDYIICIIYIPVLYGILYLYAKKKYHSPLIRKQFLWGITAKLVGAIGVGLVYQYYYRFGDTFGYFNMGRFFSSIIEQEPGEFYNVFFGTREYISAKAYQYDYSSWYAFNPATVLIARISAFLGYFSFGLYLPTAILFALFSFSGIWQLFKTFAKQFPALTRELGWFILFIPSVFFWGSGILKDSITIGALGWLTYSVYNLFILRRGFISYSIISIIAAYMVFSIKAYVLMAYAPAVFAWIIFHYKNEIRNRALRSLLLPVFLLIFIVSFWATSNFITAEFENLAIDKLAETATNAASAISDYSAGSAYSLGAAEPGLIGLLKMVIPAIVVTLFRPFLWEVNNLFSLFSSLESLFLMGFTFYVVRKAGLKNTMRVIFTKPVVLYCLLFAILFSIPIGIASGNFGTLVRYKIPGIPFYLVGLLLAYYSSTGKGLLKQPRKTHTVRPKVHYAH